MVATINKLLKDLRAIEAADAFQREANDILIASVKARFQGSLVSLSWPTLAASLSPDVIVKKEISDAVELTGAVSQQPPDSFYTLAARRLAQELSTFQTSTVSSDVTAPAADDANSEQCHDNCISDSDDDMVSDDSAQRFAELRSTAETALKSLDKVATKRCALSDRADDILKFWQLVQANESERLKSEYFLDSNQSSQMNKFFAMFKPIILAIISIQMSSADAERVFSTAGWIAQRRTSITLRTMVKLLRVRHWFKTTHFDNFDAAHWRAELKNIVLDIWRARKESKLNSGD